MKHLTQQPVVISTVHNEKHVIKHFKWNEILTVKMYVEVIPQTEVIRLGIKLPSQVK